MKISMEIRPKDIFLLKVLACVLIAFLMIRFLIFPAIDKHMDLAAQRTDTEAQQEEMQSVMDRTGSIDVKIAKQQEMLQSAKGGYYDVLENRQVDELITGIVLDHKLFPVYLNITGTTSGVPSAYTLAAQTHTDTTADASGSDNASESDTSDAADTSDTADTTQEETSAIPAAYVNTTSVDVTIQGDETEIRAFLDDIANNYPGIQVTSFSMQENEYVNSSLQTVSQMSCDCTIAVYTCGEN